MKTKTKKTSKAKVTHSFFRGMPAACRQTILDHADVITRRPGEYIFQDGGRADKFYLLITGKVDILTEYQDVRIDPEATLGILITLEPGDVIGWSWIIPPYRWRFNARVREKARLLMMNGERLRKLCEKDHELGYQIYKRLVPEINHRMIAARMKLAMYGSEPFLTEEGG
jgi:CRP-like cAMP-binding protein